MSGEGKTASQLTAEEVEETLRDIRTHTPEGFVWKLRADSNFGVVRFELTLKKDGFWRGLFGPRWHNDTERVDAQTPEYVRRAVLIGAWNLLHDRKEKLATPDWHKLAAELQKMLNDKETN